MWRRKQKVPAVMFEAKVTKEKGKRMKWDKNMVMSAFHEFYADQGRWPVYSDVVAGKKGNKFPYMPSYDIINRLYGDIGSARKAAAKLIGTSANKTDRNGFEVPDVERDPWERETVIMALQDFYAENGRMPTSEELGRGGNNNGKKKIEWLPTRGTVCNYFGSIGKAAVAAGLPPTPQGRPVNA